MRRTARLINKNTHGMANLVAGTLQRIENKRIVLLLPASLAG